MALLPGMIAFYVSGSYRNSWELSKPHLRKWNGSGRVSRCQDLGWSLERLPLSQLDIKLKVAGDSIFFCPKTFFSGSTSQSLLSFLLLSAGFSTMFCHHWINNDLENLPSFWFSLVPPSPTLILPHKLPSLTLCLASHRQAIFYLWHNPRDPLPELSSGPLEAWCLPNSEGQSSLT